MAYCEDNKNVCEDIETEHVNAEINLDASSFENLEHPTFKNMLSRLNHIRGKVEEDDCDTANLLHHIHILHENVQEMLDLEPTDSNDVEKNEQKENLAAKITKDEKYSVIIHEYEKTIEQLTLENAYIVNKRNNFQLLLGVIETVFAEVHQKYERSKVAIEDFKNNAHVLKETIQTNEESISKFYDRYEILKSHALEQHDKAENELKRMQKNYEDEILRLKTMIGKIELKNSSLQQSVEQQEKENVELTRICDDLIEQVGQS